jgi:hypothetical protein
MEKTNEMQNERNMLSARNAIFAMLEGNTLYDRRGNEAFFSKNEKVFITRIKDTTNSSGERESPLYEFEGLSFNDPMSGLMTRWEILEWANSKASLGWVVAHIRKGYKIDFFWVNPQCPSYDCDITEYRRARILPDKSGIDESTICGFEVVEAAANADE